MATYPAPAKINLFLHVTGRRDDGYHLLQTAFQFIDFEDSLEIDVTDVDEVVRVDGADYVDADEDLAVRAARALKRLTGCRRGARIKVHKEIPAGAGLGGGSSDAATILVALNELWETGLDEHALAKLGLDLGADVPVFVHGFAAFAQGVGDELTPYTWPERHGLLVVSPVHVSTPRVFADAQLTRNTPAITIRDLEKASVGNDLQPVARRLFPTVGEALDILSGIEEFETPRMSGSGGGVFAFDTLRYDSGRLEHLARELDGRLNGNTVAKQQTRPRGSASADGCERWTVRPFKTLNRSTLHERVFGASIR